MGPLLQGVWLWYRRVYDGWNRNMEPMSRRWIAFAGAWFLGLAYVAYKFHSMYSGPDQDPSRWDWVLAYLLAFGFVDLLWGVVGSLFFMEFFRKLFYHLDLRQERTAPRIRPIVTGILERFLFTLLAIVLFRSGNETALGVIATAYVGLKGFGREKKTGHPFYVSLHSIWGSGISLAFAIFGGWLFHEMTTVLKIPL